MSSAGNQIRQALKILGVKVQDIKFDPIAEDFLIRFTVRGESHERVIAFTDIRETLLNSESTNEKASPEADRSLLSSLIANLVR